MELTILIPCLNEEKTIGICIKKAQAFIQNNNINGEILVADGGSSDDSVNIAKNLGARIVFIPEKGYGNALRKSTIYANGTYVIMGDADNSYDFSNLMPFITKLREGYDLVMGNRYLGNMEKDAMKLTHKYIGTPIISLIGKLKYKLNVGDFNCGLRGYKNSSIINLNCSCTGMEYATEMLIRSAVNNLKIAEVPIDFYKDGRNAPSHLNTLRDGIRHLKLLLQPKIKGENIK